MWVGLVLRPLLCEELWGVFAEDLGKQGPHYHRYKSTQLHKQAAKSQLACGVSAEYKSQHSTLGGQKLLQ